MQIGDIIYYTSTYIYIYSTLVIKKQINCKKITSKLIQLANVILWEKRSTTSTSTYCKEKTSFFLKK